MWTVDDEECHLAQHYRAGEARKIDGALEVDLRQRRLRVRSGESCSLKQ